jgi:hypothetical protein
LPAAWALTRWTMLRPWSGRRSKGPRGRTVSRSIGFAGIAHRRPPKGSRGMTGQGRQA